MGGGEIENRKGQNEAAEEKNPVQNSADSGWQGAAFQAWRFYCVSCGSLIRC